MKPRPGIWQKRFGKAAAKEVLDFTSSVSEDERLVHYDVMCSLAHCRMLRKQRIISPKDFRSIRKGLQKILADFHKGRFKLVPAFEDVHMSIEHRLAELIGSSAHCLHTARSRNDLIAADLRLYCRDAVLNAMSMLIQLQRALANKARKYDKVIWPGYTHLQQAQPILFSFYLLSYLYKFQRDYDGLKDVIKAINVSPLGSSALAGTGHKIDSAYTASLLKFDKCFDNALDAVSDRDYLCKTIYSLVQIMIHISSLAEDFIIFSTTEFNLVELDDTVATGSSIMPQKKNPDVCELLRAKAGKAVSNLTAVLTILTGLPVSYNRDLQELKGILFAQVDDTLASLNMIKLVVSTANVKSGIPENPTLMCATDLVDHMVSRGCKFRDAYNLVADCIRTSDGKLERVVEACAGKIGLTSSEISALLKPKRSIASKTSAGSTSFKETKRSMVKASRLIRSNQLFLKKLRSKFHV